MQYINTQTLEYPITEYQIRQAFPNTSFPKDFVAPNPYAPVQATTPPTYDKMTQNLVEQPPAEIDGVWAQQWSVQPATPEQIVERETNARKANKSQAEYLLQQTDWVEVPSVSDPANDLHLVNAAEFLSYRLALRTIAVNPPVTVTEWPTKPQEQWSN